MSKKYNRFQLKLEPSIKDKDCLWDIQTLNLSRTIANEYLQQALVTDMVTDRKKYGLVFGNDLGGYEFRIPNARTFTIFEGHTEPRGATIFPANPKAENVIAYAFDHYLDFMGFIQKNGKSNQCAYIISNGVIKEVEEYAKKTNPRYLLHAYRMSKPELSIDLVDGLYDTDIVYGTIEHLYDGFDSIADHRQNNKISLGMSSKEHNEIYRIGTKPRLKP